MKRIAFAIQLLWMIMIVPAMGEVYSPTGRIGEFLKAFERAYRAGDSEWIRGAIDKDGVIEDAKPAYLGFLGPKEGGEAIMELAVIAAPHDYQMPNTLLDVKIDPTIPVDCLITFKRVIGGLETSIQVPVGYRDGIIWLAGIKKK